MFVLKGKSGKVIGRYATREAAERRIAQLKAGAERLRSFRFASSPTRVYGPLQHEDQIVYDYRTQNPSSRAVRILRYVKNTSATKQLGCILCGAKGPTWAGDYPPTKRSRDWAAAHVQKHLSGSGSPSGGSPGTIYQQTKDEQDDRIGRLLNEAAKAGDHETVALCEAALDSGEGMQASAAEQRAARVKCLRILAEAQGAHAHSPWKRSVPNRADLIAALGLEPEGRGRGNKYAATTGEFWHTIRTAHSVAAQRARRVFGLPEPR